MPTPPKLPAIKKKGQDLLTATLLNWKNWIEWACRPTGRWPVIVTPGATGPVFSVDFRGFVTKKMIVTTEITKKVGTACGSGTAVDALFSETAGTLVEDTSPGEPVWSDNLDKKVKVGAVITVFKHQGVFWVLGVDSCGSLE